MRLRTNILVNMKQIFIHFIIDRDIHQTSGIIFIITS